MILSEALSHDSGSSRRVVSVQQIANVLPVDAVLIEFVRLRSIDVSKPRGQQWGPGRYVALILRSNGSVQTVELGPAEDIEALIILALTASEQSLDNAPQLWSQVSQEIIKPLAQATKGMKTWFISPDGELNRVPFAALSSPHPPSLLRSRATACSDLRSGSIGFEGPLNLGIITIACGFEPIF